MINCQFCAHQLPDNAKFCYKCGRQIICKQCGERLIKDAPICVVCGSEVKTNTNFNAPNHIKFSETTTERRFEACFSDQTAGNVVETLSGFLPINHQPKFQSVLDPKLVDITPEPALSAKENDEENSSFIPQQDNCATSNDADISKIFRTKADGSLSLHITDLKANSKVDFAFRASLLFIYYQNEIAQVSEVPKSDVLSFLNSLGLKNDGSYRKKMSLMKSLFSSVSPSYILSLTGEKEAEKYIEEILTSDNEGIWSIGNLSKKSASRSSGKRSSSDSYSVVASLNFSPSGKESLKDFLSRRDLKSSMELNAAFVYYLEKMIGLTGITPNHIYTCYKHANIKYPSKLRQSLTDTKRRKTWIETADMENIKIAPNGENYIEHDSLRE
ncbi:MAG: zinc ribbon domain-containing protein [Bacteroides sp.]|nr:zinc ribbon domain-containing protein [Bacteroides sp.]MBD5636382.1 zinc ribbon domain-containing protein [Clostridia bacterium]